MSMTINIPSSHASMGLLKDILDVLPEDLEIHTVTTVDNFSPHMEVHAFKLVPDHQLSLVWDMENALQEQTA